MWRFRGPPNKGGTKPRWAKMFLIGVFVDHESTLGVGTFRAISGVARCEHDQMAAVATGRSRDKEVA